MEADGEGAQDQDHEGESPGTPSYRATGEGVQAQRRRVHAACQRLPRSSPGLKNPVPTGSSTEFRRRKWKPRLRSWERRVKADAVDGLSTPIPAINGAFDL